MCPNYVCPNYICSTCYRWCVFGSAFVELILSKVNSVRITTLVRINFEVK